MSNYSEAIEKLDEAVKLMKEARELFLKEEKEAFELEDNSSFKALNNPNLDNLRGNIAGDAAIGLGQSIRVFESNISHLSKAFEKWTK